MSLDSFADFAPKVFICLSHSGGIVRPFAIKVQVRTVRIVGWIYDLKESFTKVSSNKGQRIKILHNN